MCFQRKCFLFAQNGSRRLVSKLLSFNCLPNHWVWWISKWHFFTNQKNTLLAEISLFTRVYACNLFSFIFHMYPFASTYNVIHSKCCKCNKHCLVLAILFNSKTSLFHQWAYVCRSKYVIFIRTLLFLLLAIIHSLSI